MNKREFYLEALRAGTYKKTAWNISCFALTQEAPNAWQEDPYPYRLVQKPNGFYFVSPDNGELVFLEDSIPGEPLFLALEPVELGVGDTDNVYTPVETTYGNLLANYIDIIYGLGGKVPFITGRFNSDDIEKIITPRLSDEWEDRLGVVIKAGVNTVEEAMASPVYLSELKNFCDAAFSVVAYTQVFTPADSEKTLTGPPGLIEFRQSLIDKYKDKLHQRETVGQIAKELVAFDAEYLKGDVAEGFLISKKSRNIVRMKMHLMYGAETGIEEKVDVTLIQKSLAEGWDINQFPELNNALRAGAFNRGKQTESGGEAFKDLIRAAANFKINVQDCGSKYGMGITTGRKDWLIGFSAIIEGGKSVRIDNNNVGEYLNKYVRLRSPAFCKGDGTTTSLCVTCCGDRLSKNPTGVAVAVADYGSAFLAIFLGAAHSKGISLKKLDIRRLMS